MLTRMSRSPKASMAVLTSRWPPSQSAHVVAVGDSLAAHGVDLVHDLLGRRDVAPGAVGRAPEIVDDDLGALGGEQERVLAADAPACAGDDRHPSVAERPLRHPFVVRCRRLTVGHPDRRTARLSSRSRPDGRAALHRSACRRRGRSRRPAAGSRHDRPDGEASGREGVRGLLQGEQVTSRARRRRSGPFETGRSTVLSLGTWVPGGGLLTADQPRPRSRRRTRPRLA